MVVCNERGIKLYKIISETGRSEKLYVPIELTGIRVRREEKVKNVTKAQKKC